MFNKLNPFAKKQTKKNNTKKQYAPNTKIAYRPDLVSQLTNEHQMLLVLYQRVIELVESGKSQEAKEILGQFKAKFTGHIFKENLNFYVYVQHSVKDSLTLDLISDMRTEMDGIAKTVREFISKYTQDDVVLNEEFLAGFKRIGAVLVERINQEEEYLYPTYRPVMS